MPPNEVYYSEVHKMEPEWKKYEYVAAFLLNKFRQDFGLQYVEGKQVVSGKVTDWEIDAKGVRVGDGALIIVECRRLTTSRLNQAKIAAIAYQVSDLNAVGGIVVTPIGLQEGAKRIAEAENIITVQLTPDSTTTEYVMQFLNKIYVGLADTLTLTDSLTVTVTRICERCQKGFPLLEQESTCPECKRDSYTL